MSNEILMALREAAGVYLKTRPDHTNGFCLWLGKRWDKERNPGLSFDMAYTAVSPFFQRYADLEDTYQRTWVDVYPGPTPKRVKFVEWLLKEVTEELNSTSEEA